MSKGEGSGINDNPGDVVGWEIQGCCSGWQGYLRQREGYGRGTGGWAVKDSLKGMPRPL